MTSEGHHKAIGRIAPDPEAKHPFIPALKLDGENVGFLMEMMDSNPNAWPADTRVEKYNSQEGDTMPDGARATVLSSISHPDIYDGLIMYVVEFDTVPDVPVWCGEWRLRPIQEG